LPICYFLFYPWFTPFFVSQLPKYSNLHVISITIQTMIKNLDYNWECDIIWKTWRAEEVLPTNGECRGSPSVSREKQTDKERLKWQWKRENWEAEGSVGAKVQKHRSQRGTKWEMNLVKLSLSWSERRMTLAIIGIEGSSWFEIAYENNSSNQDIWRDFTSCLWEDNPALFFFLGRKLSRELIHYFHASTSSDEIAIDFASAFSSFCYIFPEKL
jgi:hypothetical protein